MRGSPALTSGRGLKSGEESLAYASRSGCAVCWNGLGRADGGGGNWRPNIVLGLEFPAEFKPASVQVVSSFSEAQHVVGAKDEKMV